MDYNILFHAALLEGCQNQNPYEILQNSLNAEMQLLDCNACGKMNHQIIYRWTLSPPCLIIVLKRFVYKPEKRQNVRLQTSVSIPEILAS